MNTKYMLTGVAALVMGAFMLSTSVTNAYQGDVTVPGPYYDAARHESVVSALETGDYSAWLALREGRGRITQMITPDNFSQYATAQLAALDGDRSLLDAFRAELGLGQGSRNGSRNGSGSQGCRYK